MIICLTWTILPPKNIKNLKIINENVRLKDYLENILFLITKTNIKKIVFCENSNYNSDILLFIEKLAQIYWKKFEYITFLWNSKKVVTNWRWYWEQEILNYFIDNSKLLDWENDFYKLTWRYKVKNINEIVSLEANNKNIFVKMSPLDNRCSTAFFKSNIEFFKKNFYGIWEKINDELWENNQIEWVYRNILLLNKWEFSNFKKLPIFEANTGSWYKLKENFLKDSIKNILNILWLYKI